MKTIFYLFILFPFIGKAQQPSAILHDDWMNNQWQMWSGTDYYYNNQDNETVSVFSYHNSGNWYPDEEITSYYSSSGNQIVTRYYARGTDPFPDTTGRSDFEYNAYGQLISQTDLSYYNDVWVVEQQNTYTYYGISDNVYTQIYQLRNELTEDLENVVKYQFSYSNSQVQKQNYLWNGTNWELNSKTLVVLNASEEPVSETTETYTNNQWIPSELINYTYTNFGELSDRTRIVYAEDVQEGTTTDSAHYEYNQDQTINSVSHFIFLASENSLVPIRRDRYVYGSHLGMEEELETAVFIYPNPATEQITINTSEKGVLTLTDAQGNALRTIPASGNVDISDLSCGIYLIRLQTRNGIKTKSFVKQ